MDLTAKLEGDFDIRYRIYVLSKGVLTPAIPLERIHEA